MNVIEEKIVNHLYENVITKGEYPNFGSPEVHCNKCMFYEVACKPSDECVGCFHGWKRESDPNYDAFIKNYNIIDKINKQYF